MGEVRDKTPLKNLFYVDKNTKGEFYNCGCISFDMLKAFVVSEYYNVVQYNKMLYLTTCKWNGTKPTAFKSAFTNICCINCNHLNPLSFLLYIITEQIS